MREIVTRNWCDAHAESGEKVEATVTRIVSLDGNVGRELDLCAECNESVLGLVAKLSEAARVTETTARRPGTARNGTKTKTWFACELCSAAGPYTNPKSLVDHIWLVHVGQRRPPTPNVCPECGIEMEHATGMGNHRARKHNFDPVAEAYEAVNNPPPITPAPRRRRPNAKSTATS